MLKHAQKVIFEAIQSGWMGPPFDPIALADMLKIKIVPSADVRDARTVPGGTGGRSLRIEFNPNRPRARVRYSHCPRDGAHVFFPIAPTEYAIEATEPLPQMNGSWRPYATLGQPNS